MLVPSALRDRIDEVLFALSALRRREPKNLGHERIETNGLPVVAVFEFKNVLLFSHVLGEESKQPLVR